MANEYLYVEETDASVRSKFFGYAKSAGLLLSNWIANAVGRQIVETVVPTVRTFTQIAARASRGFASLDTSTDQGDVDPYDPTNETLPPEPGYLSDLGANVFGTDRIDKDYARGTEQFNNTGAGATSQTFAPFALTFQRTGPPDPATGLSPTYRNSDGYPTYDLVGGGTLSANPDHTLTVGVGVQVYLPIICETPGSIGNAGPSTVTIQGNSLPGVTVTNPAAVLGSDREGARPYRDRCRIAPAAVSPNGPADAYRYIALGAQKDATGNIFYFPVASNGTALGVDPDGNETTFPAPNGTTLGVTRVYVSKDSATGNVLVYFARSDGAATGDNVTDLTALFNAVYWPDASSRSFNAATPHSVTVTATAIKAKAGAGVTAASVAANITVALTAFFAAVPIGGEDQIAGAGTLYLDALRSAISNADPAIYHVALSAPSGDVALSVGQVATLTNNITSSDVTIV